ncbi:hypothetical protein KC326_g128 [Hortaea werneckii]|nr:hypothetical protein KC326_g128 [Hortaea werneckii]
MLAGRSRVGGFWESTNVTGNTKCDPLVCRNSTYCRYDVLTIVKPISVDVLTRSSSLAFIRIRRKEFRGALAFEANLSGVVHLPSKTIRQIFSGVRAVTKATPTCTVAVHAGPVVSGSPRTDHPVLHSEPRAPGFLCRCPPATVLGREQVIAPLAVDVRHDSSHVVIAKEAMQDGRFIECGDNQATDIGNEGDEDGRRWVGRCARAVRTVHAATGAGKGIEAEGGARATWDGGGGVLGWGGGSDRVARRLERQADVDQRTKSLGGRLMLGVVEKVALAGGVGGMPLQDIEVRVARHGRRRHGRCRCRGGRKRCRAVCHAVEGTRMVAEGSVAIHRYVAGGEIINWRMQLRRRRQRRRRWRLLARMPMAAHADSPTPLLALPGRANPNRSINQTIRQANNGA